MLSQKKLKELLDYNPTTGVFVNKIRRNPRAPKGKVANSLDSKGYIRIQIDKKRYLAHRLAWLYQYGKFPSSEIDHINRIKTDNKITNLREATRVGNCINSSKKNNNTSGVTGVSWHTRHEKWQTYIQVNKKHIHLGFFVDYKDAVKTRYHAEIAHEFIKWNNNSTAKIYLENLGI